MIRGDDNVPSPKNITTFGRGEDTATAMAAKATLNTNAISSQP